jgi:hypothetical protein
MCQYACDQERPRHSLPRHAGGTRLHDGPRLAVELDAHQQARAAHLLHVRHARQRGAQAGNQLRAARGHVLQERGRSHTLHGVQRRGAHQRPARERAAVVAGRHGRRHRLRAQQAADGQPRRQRLGDSHDVGRDAHCLVRPERAGAAQAALHLVEDEQRAGGVADLAQAAQEVCLRGAHAALALHGLHEHRRRLALADQLARRRQVAVRREAHARHQRLERRAVALLRAGPVSARVGSGSTCAQQYARARAFQVSASAPMVRPWKPSAKATNCDAGLAHGRRKPLRSANLLRCEVRVHSQRQWCACGEMPPGDPDTECVPGTCAQT